MMNEISKRYVASIHAPYDTLNTIPGHRYRGWQPCLEWCEERFGKGGWWYIGEGIFEFNDKRDYLMFVLRWGS
jgi:hypothetical protein